MDNAFVGSLSMVDTSGRMILAVILILLATSVGSTLLIRLRYFGLERELRNHKEPARPFNSRALNRIVEDARQAFARSPDSVNSQGIIEHRFQTELRGLLVGERFVKASVGLAIILGLVGTFYGLTSSIGKLVGLVSAESPNAADVTQAVTQGLRQALSGMSVAFSCSLFGIMAAIIMTLLGVFMNVADCRTRAMVAIEVYLDKVLLSGRSDASGQQVARSGPVGAGHVTDEFGKAVVALQTAVSQFDSALQRFATNTRDFQEFNLHLKDNIQRMSLAFGDLTDKIKGQVGGQRPHP